MLQFDLTTKSASRRWRLGIEFYGGRSQLGEFFQEQERYWSVGLWTE